MRGIRWNVEKISRVQPDMLAQARAVPCAGLAAQDVDGALMLRMQVRLRPAPRRNRDHVHTELLRSGRLRGHACKIIEALLAVITFPPLDHHARRFVARLHLSSMRLVYRRRDSRSSSPGNFR